MAVDHLGPYTAIVGPARSGTTWLWQYLKAHSTVSTTVLKENDWFSEHWQHRNPNALQRQRDMSQARLDKALGEGRALTRSEQAMADRLALTNTAEYRAYLAKYARPNAPVVDISPSYSRIGTAAFQDMAQHFPDARVVILMRNPPDRAWSGAAHRMRLKGKPGDSAQDHYEAQDQLSGPLELQMLPRVYVTARTVLGADRVLALYTEELFGDGQEAVLDNLCHFMGGQQSYDPGFHFERHLGQYAPMPGPLRHESVLHYAQTYLFAQQLMGYLPPAWQRDWDQYAVPHLNGHSFKKDRSQ